MLQSFISAEKKLGARSTLNLRVIKRFYLSERYRDEFNKMRRQIENISGKMDALTESRQETKDEGKFSKLTHRTASKR